MIKLQLPSKPLELDPITEQQLIDEFKASGKTVAVWKKSYIKTALKDMTNNKCAYSEITLGEESKYMEIEHFKCKYEYPDEVVKWGNLLPACKKCNDIKGTLDVVKTPIVNPLTDSPGDHLYVRGFRFYQKDEKGENTIGAVALNDREHFVQPRSVIGFKISDELESNFELLKSTLGSPIKQRNALNKIKAALRECGMKYSYSAVLSTYILYEVPTYKEMETYLIQNGLWDNEFEDIKRELNLCALPIPE